ncbi:MAG: DNA double-strand break repair nuclease NurA [Candidatus Aenigmarchaeota archaeon]|nr:DNA double-strand break repair nuclease NurA [Candidatus Aenigmarchaeota archaeon]
MATVGESPFEELPEGLVEEMLLRSKQISIEMSSQFGQIFEQKESIRKTLEKQGLLHNINNLPTPSIYPTSCGIDGAYALERLVSTDFACVAAVAVEGLTPPGPEKRYWPKPRFFSHIDLTTHNEATSQVLRGMSASIELHLAVHAPHDVVFLDGSFLTHGIFLNNATVAISQSPTNLKNVFLKGKDVQNEDNVKFPGFVDALNAYKIVLSSSRSDKIFAALPKYTTKNEVCERLGLPNHEDRGLLNFVLKGDEFIGPLEVKESAHIKVPTDLQDRDKIEALVQEITHSLFPKLCIIYYRPSDFMPVIRVEVTESVAKNSSRLSILLKALQIQCVSPSIMEPYPLYLADRMVKHLSTALPAIRRSATQEITESWKGDVGDILIATHGYRTEWG